ncbi:MAG TPA: HAD family hydrolase [Segetibacter sp.]|jgi:D,D-heptose 1,7-bisphosphate phosphatase
MAEKRKAVFLDKDGTIIPDIPYNVDPELITLADGVIEGMKLLKAEEYIFVVISNQAGVAKGLFELDKLEKVKHKLDLLFFSNGIKIESYYFCPHHPMGKIQEYAIECKCRKPAPGMILQAANDLQINVSASWMIGDILNDVEAGNRAGCRTCLIDNGNETEWVKGPFRTPTYISANFLEAAKHICKASIQTPTLNDKKLAGL